MGAQRRKTDRQWPRDILAWLVTFVVLAYRYTLAYFIGGRCRHVPTCSEYGLEALARHGGWYGTWLLLARIARCRPGGTHGYDPVPEQLVPAPFWAPWRAAGRAGRKDQRADV